MKAYSICGQSQIVRTGSLVVVLPAIIFLSFKVLDNLIVTRFSDYCGNFTVMAPMNFQINFSSSLSSFLNCKGSPITSFFFCSADLPKSVLVRTNMLV